jgi:hypothetical protein
MNSPEPDKFPVKEEGQPLQNQTYPRCSCTNQGHMGGRCTAEADGDNGLCEACRKAHRAD